MAEDTSINVVTYDEDNEILYLNGVQVGAVIGEHTASTSLYIIIRH